MPNGIFIPYSFDPAFASGFVYGAIETVDGIIKIVEVISCHDITSPTFYTDRCKDVRTQTWNTMGDIMNIIIYEDKREAFFRDIGTMFSEYVDETLGLDNQARYNQGKLAFNAVSMFFGAGEIKAATKSGKLIQTLSTNLKKLNQLDFADKIGIKQSPLSQMESGKILPSIETLSKIIRVFNISYSWLIDGEGDMFLEETKSEKIPSKKTMGKTMEKMMKNQK